MSVAAVWDVLADIGALVQSLVLFQRDDDVRVVQSQFDNYLRVIRDSFHDIWSPNASASSNTDMVVGCDSVLILPVMLTRRATPKTSAHKTKTEKATFKTTTKTPAPKTKNKKRGGGLAKLVATLV